MSQAFTPGLFAAHPTLAALYARIWAEPGADEPRLEFADAAQEAADDWAGGLDSDREDLRRWARLIQVQYELERHGSAPFVIEEASLIPRGGPGYFTCDVDMEEDCPFIKVDDRVDVKTHPGVQSMFGLKPYYHRLCVKKITPADGYETRLSLKQDEGSTPYPREAVKALETEVDLFIAPGDGSLWGWYAPLTFPGGLHWHWGFPSKLLVAGHDLTYLNRIVGHFPVREVEFKSWPRAELAAESARSRFAYELVGVPPGTVCEPFDGGWFEAQQVVVPKLVRRHWPRVTSWRFPP